jgi:hypothetical protein
MTRWILRPNTSWPRTNVSAVCPSRFGSQSIRRQMRAPQSGVQSQDNYCGLDAEICGAIETNGLEPGSNKPDIPSLFFPASVIDFTKETPLSLAAAAKRFGVAVQTIRRWVRGVGGLRLETAKLGGKRFTSLEAIQRFSQQSTKQKQLPFDASRQMGQDCLPLFGERSRLKSKPPQSSKRSSR